MTKAPVLLLTPDKATRSLVTQTLGQEFAVESLSDASLGLGVLDAAHRLVLVEFDMEDVNGLEFLRQVRSGRSRGDRNVAVGLLASFADNPLFMAAISLDLNALLLRPLSRSEILRRVRRMTMDDIKLKSTDHYAAVAVPLSESQIIRQEQAERAAVAVRMPGANRSTSAAETLGARGKAETGDPDFGPLVRRTISEVGVGWQIGVDVIGPGGARLVAAGAVLTPRLLARLLEIAETGALSTVWARAPIARDGAGRQYP